MPSPWHKKHDKPSQHLMRRALPSLSALGEKIRSVCLSLGTETASTALNRMFYILHKVKPSAGKEGEVELPEFPNSPSQTEGPPHLGTQGGGHLTRTIVFKPICE